MKKVLSVAIVGLILTFAFASCKASSGGHCDAYGSIDNIENNDVASK